VVAFALGHPGFGPARIAAELAGQAQVGRDPAVDQWGLAGPAPPRPVHWGQALWAGRRLRGATRAAAAPADAGAAPAGRSPRAAGPAGLLSSEKIGVESSARWCLSSVM
jgi:hypothetical protein